MPRRIRHPGLHDARGNELPHRLLDVAGTPTYLVDAGDGPPLLLIHGFGDTADGWRRVVPRLARDHRVIALDVPPFGRSSTPNSGQKLLDFYSDFFPAFFEELDIGPATVVGHSLGGAIALRLAVDNPGYVERLGLVAPAGLSDSPPWWWHALTARALYNGALSIPTPITAPLVKRGLKTFLEWRLFDDARLLQEEIDHLVDLHGSGRDLGALLAAGHACLDCYSGKLLERSMELDVPLWMLWGRKDGLVPSIHARAFAQAHPDAAVHVLERCGHYPHIELPQRFNTLLHTWLDQTAAPAMRRRRSAAA